jgi:hydroxyacylglutathione hydrolase
MLSAFDRFGALPDDTKVFCGHEYTVKNLEFGLMAEPSNPHIKQYHQKFQEII